MSVLFNFAPATLLSKNATARLFGDQHACAAPSLPESDRGVSESRSRTHNWFLPSTVATNASRRPSGESAIRPAWIAYGVLSGAAIANRTCSDAGFGCNQVHALT